MEKGLTVKLATINANNDMVMLAVIIVGFAIILWFAYSSLKSMFFTAPAAPVIAPVRQIEVPSYIPPEPKPWEKLYNPVDVMKNCYTGVKKVVSILTPGWRLEGVTCEPESGIVTSWHRQIGRMAWMEQALNVSGVEFSSRAISSDGNTFMVTMPIGEITTLNSPPEYTQEDLTNIMNDLNQTLGIQIAIEPKTWVSPRGTSYNLMGISIGSRNDPLNWIELLMKFSGLTINTVTYDPGSGRWSYKGDIYEL